MRNRSNRKFKMKSQNSLVARQTLHSKSGLEKSRKEKIAERHPISSFQRMFERRPQGATLPTVEADAGPTRRRSGSGMGRGKKSEEHDTPPTRRRLSATRLHNLLLGDVSSRECRLIVVLIMRCLVGVRLCPRLSGKDGREVSTLIFTRARVGTDRVSFHFPRTKIAWLCHTI